MGGGGGSMFRDDDDEMSQFRSTGMPGGMPGGGMDGGRARASRSRTSPFASAPSPPSDIIKPLKLSLEDLYSGTTKHLKVGRKLLGGTVEDNVLEIKVQPGWKKETKVRFPKAGNEVGGGDAQDLVFVVEEKPHDVFKREGNDLVCTIDITLVEALTGTTTPSSSSTSSTGSKSSKSVKALDGRRIPIPLPAGVVRPGQQTRIPGEGMPARKDGNVKRKGDLIVNWNVKFPDKLTSSQKEGIRKVLG
jgi:DnaJ homolog subfamily B member 4